jgi:predicted transposase/invertase (TIGR01784 family)
VFDNVSKHLIEQYPSDFATWLLGAPVTLTTLNPTELSLEPIRADSLILLQSSDLILHTEFQTAPDPTMPFRMLDYRVRVYRKFPEKRMIQVVIYLRPTESRDVYQTSFEIDNLSFQFQVIRIWEVPSQNFFQSPGLLPYAILGQTTDINRSLKSLKSYPTQPKNIL